jgi:Skp family chaperone for outer membrane proteins
MSKQTDSTNGTTNSKLDAIKEIIFGQTMQEYDQRFSSLELMLQSTIKEHSSATHKELKEIRRDIQSLKTEMEKELHELKKQTAKELAELRETKADRQALKKYLIQLVENL